MIDLIQEKIEAVKKHGHGEVVIKIKNGAVWRMLATYDILILKETKGELCHESEKKGKVSA